MSEGTATVERLDWKSFKERLTHAFEQIPSPGKYLSHGVLDSTACADYPFPSIDVDGVGALSFPITPDTILKLFGASSVAPFGKGADTVVDPEVRKAQQIEAQHVHFGAEWNTTLNAIVSSACKELGVDLNAGEVTAHLHKMLVYEPGGHFLAHQDTEKEPGMFATLIIQLPCGHEGGDLTVWCGQESNTATFGGPSSHTNMSFAAFYTDSYHELSEVTSGHRVTLAYNLIRLPSAMSSPTMPQDFVAQREHLRKSLQQWLTDFAGEPAKGSDEGSSRDYTFSHRFGGYDMDDSFHGNGLCWPLVIPLDHYYTRANLSFKRLKGRDAVLVAVIDGLADMGFERCLTLLEKQDVVGLEWEGWRRSNRSWWRYDDYDEEEEEEEEQDEDKGDADEGNVEGGDADELDVDSADDKKKQKKEDTKRQKKKKKDRKIKRDTRREARTDLNLFDCDDSNLSWSDLISVDRGGDVMNMETCIVDNTGLMSDTDPVILRPSYHSLQFLSVGLPFEGTPADKREFEDYMGNYGPQLNYWYHEAALVIWPIWAHNRMVKKTVADVLKEIDKEVEKSGWNSPAVPPLIRSVPTYKWINKGMHATVYVFTLSHLMQVMLDAGKHLPKESADDLLPPLVKFLFHNLSWGHNEATAKLLLSAEMISVLEGLPATRKVVLQCIDLAQEGWSGKEIYKLCMELLQKHPTMLAELRNVSYLRHVEACKSADAGRLSDSLTFLYGPENATSPHLLEADNVLVDRALYGRAGPDASFIDDLLKNGLVKERIRKCGDATKLTDIVRCRIEMLTAEGADDSEAPPFSWCQPLAVFPANPAVEAFLRGPDQSMRLPFPSGIQAARKWIKEIFRFKRNFSATAIADGKYKSAYCLLTKTDEWWKNRHAKIAALTTFRKQLQRLIGLPSAPTKRNTATNNAATQSQPTLPKPPTAGSKRPREDDDDDEMTRDTRPNKMPREESARAMPTAKEIEEIIELYD